MSYDEKANVSIDADGAVLKCAKSLPSAECGYVPNSPLCAKCGATPLQMKMVPMDEMVDDDMVDEDVSMQGKKKVKTKKIVLPDDMEDDEEDDEEMMDGKMMHGMPVKKKKRMKAGMMIEDDEEDEEMMDDKMMDDDEEMMDDDVPEDAIGVTKPDLKRTSKKMMPDATMMEEDDEEEVMEEDDEEDMSEEELEKALNWMKKRKMNAGNVEDYESMDEKDMHDNEMDDDEDEDDDMDDVQGDGETDDEVIKALEWALKKKRNMSEKGLTIDDEVDDESAFDETDEDWSILRNERISSLGIKSEEIGPDGFVCAINRKANPAGSSVCNDCPGGCVAEKGLPGLLHVEGLAEKAFDGFVVDSGYSPDADMFVVDVQVKDGSVREIFINGSTAEIMGFHKLDSGEFEQKSDYTNIRLIDFTEAAEIAVKSIDGQVVAVEPDVFEGVDSYAVEIEAVDGKSYDVFVALDGEILGFDKYEQEEAEQIEAEAAEIALKRAFTDEQRAAMSKEGSAMDDGSYPIASENDLRNAIQAFGRAKDKEKTKRHIMQRARELKLESLIPANWLAGSKEKNNEVVNDADFMAALVEFQLLEDNNG